MVELSAAGDGGEGAKYWLHVLTELRNRGVADVLVRVIGGGSQPHPRGGLMS